MGLEWIKDLCKRERERDRAARALVHSESEDRVQQIGRQTCQSGLVAQALMYGHHHGRPALHASMPDERANGTLNPPDMGHQGAAIDHEVEEQRVRYGVRVCTPVSNMEREKVLAQRG